LSASNGNLHALDAGSGTQVWAKSVGAAIAAHSEALLNIYTGLAAGDGLLIVPAGNNVTAYTLSTNP
jgi:outer membrane protein assembly factor BamB